MFSRILYQFCRLLFTIFLLLNGQLNSWRCYAADCGCRDFHLINNSDFQMEPYSSLLERWAGETRSYYACRVRDFVHCKALWILLYRSWVWGKVDSHAYHQFAFGHLLHHYLLLRISDLGEYHFGGVLSLVQGKVQ